MGISNDAEGGKASFSSIDLLDPAYCFGWHAVLKKHSRTPRLAAVLSYLLPITKLMYLS